MIKRFLLIVFCVIFINGCKDKAAEQAQLAAAETARLEAAKKQGEIDDANRRAEVEAAQKRAEIAREQERREAVMRKIRPLEQQRDLLAQQMLNKQQNISNLENQLTKLEAELRSYNGSVKAFMMDHKIALACMGSVGVAIDSSNQFSEEAKDFAKGAGLLCGLAFLADSDFRGEVTNVVDQLTQASSRVTDFKSQINSVNSELGTEKSVFTQANSNTVALTSQIQQYQAELN